MNAWAVRASSSSCHRCTAMTPFSRRAPLSERHLLERSTHTENLNEPQDLEDDAGGASRARVRCTARGGGPADSSHLDVRLSRVRREGLLRLHTLGQPDA